MYAELYDGQTVTQQPDVWIDGPGPLTPDGEQT